MRLNWFLPFFQAGRGDDKPRPGRLRRVLAEIGPTWLCSPLRRVIQAAAFVVFAGLFSYVC